MAVVLSVWYSGGCGVVCMVALVSALTSGLRSGHATGMATSMLPSICFSLTSGWCYLQNSVNGNGTEHGSTISEIFSQVFVYLTYFTLLLLYFWIRCSIRLKVSIATFFLLPPPFPLFSPVHPEIAKINTHQLRECIKPNTSNRINLPSVLK